MLGGRLTFGEGGTVPGRHSGSLDKIFICCGQTGERCRSGTIQLFVSGECPLSRIIRVHVHEGIELWVKPFDALEVILGELCRTRVPMGQGVVVLGEAFKVPTSHSFRLVGVTREDTARHGTTSLPQMTRVWHIHHPITFRLTLGILPDLLPILEGQERISHHEPR